MRIFLSTLVSQALWLFSSPAFSADWAYLGTDAGGNAWHIDMASVVQDHSRITAWKKIEFKQTHRHFQNGSPVSRVFILNAIDCARHQTDVKAMGFMDPESSIVSVHESGDANIQWPPGKHAALLEAARTLVCPNSKQARMD